MRSLQPSADGPRAPGRPDRLLAFGADVLLGAQLVVRPRAPRVALVIAAIVALLAAAGAASAPADPARHVALAMGLAGAVAAVAGGRLIAPGPALHAARYAAVSTMSAVVGRLLGASGILAVPALGLAALLVPHGLSGMIMGGVLGVMVAGVAVSMSTAAFAGVLPGGAFCAVAALSLTVLPASMVWSSRGIAAAIALAALGCVLAQWAVAHGRSRARSG